MITSPPCHPDILRAVLFVGYQGDKMGGLNTFSIELNMLNKPTMRTKLSGILLVVLMIAGFSSCDLFDPRNVENPNVLENSFLELDNSTELWLEGLERQMTLALNNGSTTSGDGYIAVAEIASDNYVNTQTFFNQFMDDFIFDTTDDDIEAALFTLGDLRESAEFGISTVIDSDPEPDPDDVAGIHFFKGMSHLIVGELFHLAPADSAGPLVTSEDHFQLAVTAFNEAINTSTNPADITGYHIARARTYRMLGDAPNARADAEMAIASIPDYIRFTVHDNTNGPVNDVQDALYDRGSFDDLQPLPRLDFLDPKYFNTARPNQRGDDDDADVAYIKSEEAYLILAEAQAAENDIAGAQATLESLLTVVAERPTERLADINEGRTDSAPGSRPNTSDWMVASSPGGTLRAGLVVDRAEENEYATVSGTSVTSADIMAVSTQDELLALIYLMRQEIFIAEGRRMTDLGIKWPIPFDEVTSNPNIDEGDPSQTAVVPEFLPPGEIDAFVMDEGLRVVEITHDLNAILVANKTSPLVLPFF